MVAVLPQNLDIMLANGINQISFFFEKILHSVTNCVKAPKRTTKIDSFSFLLIFKRDQHYS